MNKQIKSIPLPHHFREVLGAWLLIGSSLLLLACCTEVDRLQERSEAMVTFSLSSDALIPEVTPTRAAAVDMETGTAVRVLAYRRPDGSGSAVLSSANYVGEATYKVTSGSALEPVSAPLQLIAGTYDFYAVTPDLAVDHSGDEPTLEVRHRTDYAVSLTSKSISPGNSTVELTTLERRCALVCFETDRKEGVTGITAVKITSVSLTAMASEPQRATGMGELLATVSATELTLTDFIYPDVGKTYQSKGQMIVLPKSAATSELTVIVSFNGQAPLTLTAQIGSLAFLAGNKYVFSIRYKEVENTLTLSLLVVPWTSESLTTDMGDMPGTWTSIVIGKWTYNDIQGPNVGDILDPSTGITTGKWIYESTFPDVGDMPGEWTGVGIGEWTENSIQGSGVGGTQDSSTGVTTGKWTDCNNSFNIGN